MAAESRIDTGDQQAKRSPSRRFTGALRSLLGSLPIPFMLGSKPNQNKDQGSASLRQLYSEDTENLGSVAPDSTNLRENINRVVVPKNVVPQSLGENVITRDDSDSEVEITGIYYPSPLGPNRSGIFSEFLIVSRRNKSLRKRLPISTKKTRIFSRDQNILPANLSEQTLPRKRKKFKSVERNKKRFIINPSSESEGEVDGETNLSGSTPKTHKVNKKLLQHSQSPKQSGRKSASSEKDTSMTAIQNNVSDETLNRSHNPGQDKAPPKPKPIHEEDFHFSESELDTSRVEYVGLNSALSSTYEAELLRLIEEADNLRLEVTRAQLQAGSLDDEKLLAEIEAQFKFLAMPLGEQVSPEGESAIEKQTDDFQRQNERTQFPDHDDSHDESGENMSREQIDTEVFAARPAIDVQENMLGEVPTESQKQKDGNDKSVCHIANILKASENIKPVSPPELQDSEKKVEHEDVPRLFQGSRYPRLSVPQPSPLPRNSTFSLSSPHTGVLEAGVVHQITIHSAPHHRLPDNSIEFELRQAPGNALGADTEEHAEDREKYRIRNRKRRQGAQRKRFRLQRKNRLLKLEPMPTGSEVVENGRNKEMSTEVEIPRANSNSPNLVEKSNSTDVKDMDADVGEKDGNSEGSLKSLAPEIMNENVKCTDQSWEQRSASLQKEEGKSMLTELAFGNGPGHSAGIEPLKSTVLIDPKDFENNNPSRSLLQSTQTPSLPIVSKTQQNREDIINNDSEADYQNTERAPNMEIGMIISNIEPPKQSHSGKNTSSLPINRDTSGSFLPLSSQSNVQPLASLKSSELSTFESNPHQLSPHDRSRLQTPHVQEELAMVSHDVTLDIISISLGLSSRSSSVSSQLIENDANSEPQPYSQGISNSVSHSEITFLGTVIPNSSQSIQASQRRMPLTSQIAINSSQESQMNSTIESLKQVKRLTKPESPLRLRNNGRFERTVRGSITDFTSSEIVTVDSESEPEQAPVSIAEIIRRKFAEAGTKFEGFKIDDDSDD